MGDEVKTVGSGAIDSKPTRTERSADEYRMGLITMLGGARGRSTAQNQEMGRPAFDRSNAAFLPPIPSVGRLRLRRRLVAVGACEAPRRRPPAHVQTWTDGLI